MNSMFSVRMMEVIGVFKTGRGASLITGGAGGVAIGELCMMVIGALSLFGKSSGFCAALMISSAGVIFGSGGVAFATFSVSAGFSTAGFVSFLTLGFLATVFLIVVFGLPLTTSDWPGLKLDARTFGLSACKVLTDIL